MYRADSAGQDFPGRMLGKCLVQLFHYNAGPGHGGGPLHGRQLGKLTGANIKYGDPPGCYIATAVYGSYDCPQVWTLRRFRDHTLAASWYGRTFLHAYYAVSPTLVKWFGRTAWFQKLWRGPLDRLVARLRDEGVADTPYQDREW